jgi:PAS domain S-box-containing protein
MRTRLLLLVLSVSLVSLAAGVLAARPRHGLDWTWLVALAGFLALAAAWIHFLVLLPLERDLDQRAQAEEEAQRRAQEVEELYNRAPCGYHSLDAGGRFVRINDTALSWLGCQRDEVVGRPFTDFLPPEFRQTFLERFAQFQLEGHVRDVELHLVRKDGSLMPVLLSAVARYDEDGRFVTTRSTFIDLSERVRAERRLLDLSLRLSSVLEAATSVGVIATDLAGRVTLFNAGAERLLGYPAGEMLGRRLGNEERGVAAEGQSAFPLREGFGVLVERARRGESEPTEWDCFRKDGAPLTVELVVTPLRGGEGEVAGFLFVAADVSERNRARERLRMTMEAARIGTWEWDFVSGRCAWSENVPTILGKSDLGRESADPVQALVAAEDQQRVRSAFEAALHDPARHDAYEAEFRILDDSGRPRWVEAKGRVFRDADGTPRQMLGTVMDVTGRRRASEALGEAKAAAESANEAKTAFLTNLSHEIRTPLGAIIGLVEMIQQWAAGEGQRQQVRTLAAAAETLLSLINDVLDVSKIEAGKLELEAAPFDLGALVREVAAVLGPAAARKGLALNVELGEGAPARVVGDAARLRQVLMNLVGNAVKFTPAGEVSVRVSLFTAEGAEVRREKKEETAEEQDLSSPVFSLRTSAPSAVNLHFTVSDTGVGIPADRLRAIFEPFEQADLAVARTHGGTGLGLTIAARLVQRMGGEIRVQSQPGKGSTFSFQLALPAAGPPSQPAEPPPQPATGQPPLRVLLVEDNPVNQHVLTLMLQGGGHRVTHAPNGREALLALDREAFDLVLMDLQMPEMDGLRCARLIRQREKATGRRVPIVAVTANALQGERQRCLAAGMDEYLSKPVRNHELVAVIARLLGRAAGLAGAAGEDEEAPAWLRALREMGFDDDGVARLTQTFLDTVPGRMGVLRRAVEARDCEEVHRTAHVLKGSLAVFSAQAATGAAMRLMLLGQQRRPEGFAAALAELEAEVGPLLESMRRRGV